jgi:hypothetical protein
MTAAILLTLWAIFMVLDVFAYLKALKIDLKTCLEHSALYRWIPGGGFAALIVVKMKKKA